MTTAGPHDGGSNPSNLKEKLKYPFGGLREKFRDSSLYDAKVAIINKKCLTYPAIHLEADRETDTKLESLPIW
jgi:hypothetical protein